MRIGVIIVGIVILAILGYLSNRFFLNADVHLALRIGMGAIGGGVLWLVVQAIKGRIPGTKIEEPKEIKK